MRLKTPVNAWNGTVLVLGGTPEARQIVKFLIGRTPLKTIISLAGVLGNDAKQVLRQQVELMAADRLAYRLGGFGGIDGLVNYLDTTQVSAVIDATHAFARQISANAHEATLRAGIPLLRYLRPQWQSIEGDQWKTVRDLKEAAKILPPNCHAMLAIGRMSYDSFRSRDDCQFLLRSIGPVDSSELPGNFTHIQAMPGHVPEEEMALMKQFGVDCLVTKNSGGDRSYLKLVAARYLRLPVVMVERPELPYCAEVSSLNELDLWLDQNGFKM
ncbi:precorrin-6A/cobalt-precorrin-6A reductase [uncultured Cohaesibacter sp.]|uniref:precorrin-6A/cobalt-precorrin-6A reductase n=1 Tax=uncultured Cohaesibacter sp. TaxID=1002546 RepID=UPI0029C90F58|nr:precorrin-6A/cobalt-precorrin-6A reductase [uncultured Cohaesibacter sp.]